jgi:hypothetical protein
MPNPKASIVYLADILDTPNFSKAVSENLTNLSI